MVEQTPNAIDSSGFEEKQSRSACILRADKYIRNQILTIPLNRENSAEFGCLFLVYTTELWLDVEDTESYIAEMLDQKPEELDWFRDYFERSKAIYPDPHDSRMQGEVAIADAQTGDRRKVKEWLVKKMKEERGNRYHHTKLSRKLNELISKIDDFGPPFHLPSPVFMDSRFNVEYGTDKGE